MVEHGTMTEPVPTPWTQVFHRSRMSPHIFVVQRTYVKPVRDLLGLLDLPHWGRLEMFGTAYSATPLLDGLVHLMDPSGLPPVPGGLRVIGHRPLRLLCDLLKLVPPKRLLAGESVIPSREELLAELAAQRAMPKDYLEAQAQLGLHTSTAEEMRQMVEQLFGLQVAGKRQQVSPPRAGGTGD
jgi:hypothetical protein